MRTLSRATGSTERHEPAVGAHPVRDPVSLRPERYGVAHRVRSYRGGGTVAMASIAELGVSMGWFLRMAR
jgi:hypothetical protein